jgi:hypothetical protein
MPGQKRLKGRLKHFLHSLVPGRKRSPSHSSNRPITPTLDPQASSKSVVPDLNPTHGIPDTQPPNSPSNIYPSIVIKPAGGKSDLASSVFQGVKTPTLDPQASSKPVGPDPNLSYGIPDTQPLNSPSSNIYPSIVIKPAGEKSDLASTVFQGVKTTLQLVERAADAFPPLKSTVAGLLGIIDIVEVRDF